MKTLTEHLTQYAAYHRDKRNILTHFVGIPLIMLAVAILLSRPGMHSGGLWLSPALAISIIAAVYYLLLDTKLGTAMTATLAIFLWLAAQAAQLSTWSWLGWGVGLFFIGWLIQFVGHYFEGRKPAFLDDIMSLAIGPIFVAAELAFILGLRKSLHREIEKRLAEQ